MPSHIDLLLPVWVTDASTDLREQSHQVFEVVAVIQAEQYIELDGMEILVQKDMGLAEKVEVIFRTT